MSDETKEFTSVDIVQHISKNDFAVAKDMVQTALFAKANQYIDTKRPEVASTLVTREDEDAGETPSGQG